MKLITNPRNSCKEFRKVRKSICLQEIKPCKKYSAKLKEKPNLFSFIMTMRLTCLKKSMWKSLTVL